LRRTIVLTLALLFVALFAFLTAVGVADTGLSALSVISILILILLGVGVIGALLNPPPPPR
jgi:hypothetical protein